MLKLMVAEGRRRPPSTRWRMAVLLLPIFGGVAYTGPLSAMISAERMLGWKPDAIRRLAALCGRRHRGRQAGRHTLAADQCRSQGAGFPWAIAGGGSPAWTRATARGAGSIGSARITTATACCWHGARAGGRYGFFRALARALRSCRSAWARARKFPLKAADFIGRGIAEGPVLGQVAGAGRRRLAGGGIFPWRKPRLQNHRRPGRGTFLPAITGREYHFRLRRYFLASTLAGRLRRAVCGHRRRPSPATAPAR